MRGRVLHLGLFFGAAFALVGGRLFQLQILKDEVGSIHAGDNLVFIHPIAFLAVDLQHGADGTRSHRYFPGFEDAGTPEVGVGYFLTGGYDDYRWYYQEDYVSP